jgi:hypothetical protein
MPSQSFSGSSAASIDVSDGTRDARRAFQLVRSWINEIMIM